MSSPVAVKIKPRMKPSNKMPADGTMKNPAKSSKQARSGGKNQTRKSRKKAKPIRSKSLNRIPDGLIAVRFSDQSKEALDLYALELSVPVKIIDRMELIHYIYKTPKCELLDILRKLEAETTNDEIAIVSDALYRYGTNFYLAIRRDRVEQLKAKYNLGRGQDADVIDTTLLRRRGDRWLSLGSADEIKEWLLPTSRPKHRFVFERPRKYFGAECKFQDRNACDNPVIEILPDASLRQDLAPNQCFVRDAWIQTDTYQRQTQTQTRVVIQRNRAVQYEALQLSDDQIQKHLKQTKLKEFLKRSLPMIEGAIAENQLIDFMADDIAQLASVRR